MTPFKPMLAGEADLATLRYPLLASPKLDGIRAIVRGGQMWSRSLKLIPNKHIQKHFSAKRFEYLDGELIVGLPTSKTCYRDTVSVVMSHDKPCDDVTFFAFDHIEFPGAPYVERQEKIPGTIRHASRLIHNLDFLLEYESEMLELGYEGLILRDPDSTYKCGRSSTKQGILLKLKRFVDAEAIIIGFEERMHNGNEAKKNELGRTARSSHKANMVPMGTLGALICDFNGQPVNIGTGFDDEQRAEIWGRRDEYVGELAKFKYFPVGVKDAPRHPVWLGIRDRRDT